MIEALERYLVHAARTEDHLGAVVAGLESVAERPWDVVRLGTLLSRSELVRAPEDLGIRRNLTITTPGGKDAVLTVDAGQPFPRLGFIGRRSRAGCDPPLDLARRVVAATLAAARGPVQTALDPACASGAFLLALHEAGVPEIYGCERDPVALAVAAIAVPTARLLSDQAWIHGPPVDVVVGAPPFHPPARQDRYLRKTLRRRHPWLKHRFDVAVPFAANGVERVRDGGAVGLVLPSTFLVRPFAAPLRRRWLQRHRVADLSGPHHFTETPVHVVVLGAGQAREPMPVFGMSPDELMGLENVPFNVDLMPGDVELVHRIRACSVDLGRIAAVDTGLIAYGPEGSQQRLIHEQDGEGRVPYADAIDFFSSRLGYLDYDADKLHRAKSPDLFQTPKIVVQIARSGPVRAAIDWNGVYLGHTCSLVRPHEGSPPLERLLALLRSPLMDGLGRVEWGMARQLDPHVLGKVPVPRRWLDDPGVGLEEAWGLNADEAGRLKRLVR